MQKNLICFDLEGPLSPQDNAYEVMGLIPEGHKIFEVISKYDDILTLEKRENYEPGDTLSLIVPFLLYYDVSEEDIKKVSKQARIVPGAKEFIAELKEKLNFDVYIISTSYQQHAFNIGEQLCVEKENIYCTKFPIEKFKGKIAKSKEDSSLIEKIEKEILETLHPNLDNFKLNDKNSALKKTLEKFFWSDLMKTKLGKIMREVKVVGGQRKVDALESILKKTGKKLKEIIVVGDSITDFKMLEKVKRANGISVVFNGNEYALPYGNIGLATLDMRFLLLIVNAFIRGGKEKVIETVKNFEKNREELANTKKIPEKFPNNLKEFLIEKFSDENFIMPYFHYLENIDEKKRKEILQIHKKFRAFVRGEATAKLG